MPSRGRKPEVGPGPFATVDADFTAHQFHQALEHTPKGWRVTVPRGQRLEESSLSAMATFAVSDFTRWKEVAVRASPIAPPDSGVLLLTLLDALARAALPRGVSRSPKFRINGFRSWLSPTCSKSIRTFWIDQREGGLTCQRHAQCARLELQHVSGSGSDPGGARGARGRRSRLSSPMRLIACSRTRMGAQRQGKCVNSSRWENNSFVAKVCS
jgi:hypothetical protein